MRTAIACCGAVPSAKARSEQRAGTRFLKGDIKQLAYFRDKSRRATVEFEVIIAQPGASAAALNDDALLLLGTTELYLKKTAAAGLRVIVSP